jgi:selenocysteine lyase/cysteine desulfurase
MGVGWHSVPPSQDYTHIELNLRPTAARYEGGSQNNAGMLALGASLQLLMDCGIANLAASILDITDRACQRLSDIGAKVVSDRRPDHRGGEQRSGIVSFELPGRDPLAVKRHSLRQNVVFGCRAGRLRISPHAYNNEDDLDRLVDALKSFPG